VSTPAGTRSFDVVVVGSGVAGSSAAVRLATRAGARVALLTKGTLEESNTNWAQGGIAAVSDSADSTDSHLADTLRAGAGLCDEVATRILVEEGPGRLAELIGLGAAFDRALDGQLERGLEGGHSHPRIVHAAGAATGAEVARTLVAALWTSGVEIFQQCLALDLIVEDGRCVGLEVIGAHGVERIVARHVVLATGGAGQLFAVTTNPPEATGDGAAMALRAGVGLADIEFVQFHPTALSIPSLPRPLLSEALRGEGAVLRDRGGARFVDELQPRHLVSRAIAAQMAADGEDHVFLDATPIPDFAVRFPSLATSLSRVGLDPSHDLLPVAPAAHYACGGVLTDLDGATEMAGLWAVGEAACTGVQGANRLASNSLLEGLVFGARVADAIGAGKLVAEESGALGAAPPAIAVRRLDLADASPSEGRTTGDPRDIASLRRELQRSFSDGAGVVRSAASLERVAAALARVHAALRDVPGPPIRERVELVNLVSVGSALVTAAIAREESRGAHTRIDFPSTEAAFRHRQLVGARAEGNVLVGDRSTNGRMEGTSRG